MINSLVRSMNDRFFHPCSEPRSKQYEKYGSTKAEQLLWSASRSGWGMCAAEAALGKTDKVFASIAPAEVFEGEFFAVSIV